MRHTVEWIGRPPCAAPTDPPEPCKVCPVVGTLVCALATPALTPVRPLSADSAACTVCGQSPTTRCLASRGPVPLATSPPSHVTPHASPEGCRYPDTLAPPRGWAGCRPEAWGVVPGATPAPAVGSAGGSPSGAPSAGVLWASMGVACVGDGQRPGHPWAP